MIPPRGAQTLPHQPLEGVLKLSVLESHPLFYEGFGAPSRGKEKGDEMYHVIGLTESGKLSLWCSYDEYPPAAMLEEKLERSTYTQVLVITDNKMVDRYVYERAPRLVRVASF